jgi:hypothetical protein
MAAAALTHFCDILRANHYKPSTSEAYVRQLKASGVNLLDKRAVHRVVSSRIFDDFNGEKFRAFLAYDRFLRNKPLPGGISPKRGPPMSVKQFCLKQNKRDDAMRAWWLLNQHPKKQYSVGTAQTYLRNLHKQNKHKDGERARAAFGDYAPGRVVITDLDVSRHVNNLPM